MAKNNILRTLIFNREISLTLVDSSDIVREAIRLHGLSRASAAVFGKMLTVAGFMASCLKESTGSVSLSVKGGGECGNISVSGDYALHIRGCIDVPNALADVKAPESRQTELLALGSEGSFSVIRSDGYGMPFVGACGFSEKGGCDENAEEYYRISEQLPTYIATAIHTSESGNCLSAGGVFLQPLPFASAESLAKIPSREKLYEIARALGERGIEKTAEDYFAEDYFSAKKDGIEERRAEYKCNCSKEYLSGVLMSLGKDQLEEILAQDGKIGIHCHYCNKDYTFFKADIDKLFS